MLNTTQGSGSPASSLMALAQTGKPQDGAKSGQALKAGEAAKSDMPKKGVEEAQDRFLKLLVTQMKNQDPLNPMDNAQVTSQMAQLSTVSGIDKLNATLAALSGSMIASQSMQAATMIGHVVLVPGNKMELKGGKAAAGIELKQPADNVTVQITDASGNIVRTLKLDRQPIGVLPIQWDGKNDADTLLPDGNYQLKAVAQLGLEKSDAVTLSYGLVSGVSKKADGASAGLTVEQLGEVSMDSVKQIL